MNGGTRSSDTGEAAKWLKGTSESLGFHSDSDRVGEGKEATQPRDVRVT